MSNANPPAFIGLPNRTAAMLEAQRDKDVLGYLSNPRNVLTYRITSTGSCIISEPRCIEAKNLRAAVLWIINNPKVTK